MSMADLTEKIIGNGKLTASARIAILVFSIIGTTVAPFALGGLVRLNETLGKIDTHLAVQDEHTKSQDGRNDALEAGAKTEDLTVQDHSARIIRLETKAGIGTP